VEDKKPLDESSASALEKRMDTFIKNYGERIQNIFGCLANGDLSGAKESSNGNESDLRTASESLANTLEEVVAYVEFGDQPST
jgi:hypothetical protein